MIASIVPTDTLQALLREAEASPPGCFVEVGVYQGGSARRLHEIAVRQRRELHLFDTFCGMPFSDPGDQHAVGEFSNVVLGDLVVAMPQAQFHVGVFPDTIPRWGLPPIAFAHIDCDQGRSIRDCIDHLWALVVPGGTLWFDDYSLPGARKAILKRFDETELQSAPEQRVFVRKKP